MVRPSVSMVKKTPFFGGGRQDVHNFPMVHGIGSRENQQETMVWNRSIWGCPVNVPIKPSNEKLRKG